MYWPNERLSALQVGFCSIELNAKVMMIMYITVCNTFLHHQVFRIRLCGQFQFRITSEIISQFWIVGRTP
jgi:hypothetical protein